MLAYKHKDMSLQALNIVVGMYLQPFEGVYNLCTYVMWKEFMTWVPRTYIIPKTIEGVYNIYT